MSTTTLTAAANGPAPVNSSGPANLVLAQRARVHVTANPTAADIVELFKLPAGAQIIGAHLRADALDTDGSAAALTLKLGVTENDDAFFTTTSGVFVKSEVLALDDQDVDAAAYALAPTADTKVILTWGHAAATFTAGYVDVVVEYTTPGSPTS